MKKKYVKVYLEMDENGKKTPKSIVYNDQKFEIDRVLDVRTAPSMKVGGVGERYTIRIDGKETYIFLENNKWFVEEK
jgi:hypothetical protein